MIDLGNDNQPFQSGEKIGEVTTWYMTEEERLAYIEKYPIRPTPIPVFIINEKSGKRKAKKRKNG